jgi:PAS domain S-box-containing protein
MSVEEDLKNSELKYRRLFETAQDGILILDGESGEIIDANKFIIDMLGYPLEYFVGKHLWELGFITDKSLAQDAYIKLKRDAFIRYEDLPLETRSGKRIDVEFISNMYPVNNHRIIQCNIRDITDRKRAETALALTSRKLSLLSSITRHDINNQLMTLNGFLELLHREVPDPGLETYFTRIAAVSSRIERMIRFTREYEQIGVNAPAWQDCNTLVDMAIHEISSGTVTISTDIPAGSSVYADPLIAKVFFNLLDNAVRYGQKLTAIRFFLEERDGSHVLVCEDDGIGVPADEKEKIFERGVGKNTGLGLTLSRDILSITGITIRETGIPGEGARFEISVPEGSFRSGKEPVP